MSMQDNHYPNTPIKPHPHYGSVVLGALILVALFLYWFIQSASPGASVTPDMGAGGGAATSPSSIQALWAAMQLDVLFYVAAGCLIVGMFLVFRWRAQHMPRFDVMDPLKLSRYLEQEWRQGALTPEKVGGLMRRMDGAFKRKLQQEVKLHEQASAQYRQAAQQAQEMLRTERQMWQKERQEADRAFQKERATWQAELSGQASLLLEERRARQSEQLESARVLAEYRTQLGQMEGQLLTLHATAGQVPALQEQARTLQIALQQAESERGAAEQAEAAVREVLDQATDWAQEITGKHAEAMSALRTAHSSEVSKLKQSYQIALAGQLGKLREAHAEALTALTAAHTRERSALQADCVKLREKLAEQTKAPRYLPLALRDDRKDPTVVRVCAVLEKVAVTTHGGTKQSLVLDSWRRQRALFQALNQAGLRISVAEKDKDVWLSTAVSAPEVLNSQEEVVEGRARVIAPAIAEAEIPLEQNTATDIPKAASTAPEVESQQSNLAA